MLYHVAPASRYAEAWSWLTGVSTTSVRVDDELSCMRWRYRSFPAKAPAIHPPELSMKSLL